ncbi:MULTISPECIES: gliding motility protein GldB-related protein [Epilithonimonas]|uniref:SbsA Ig-like domain-containing protein n=1 Tax=Epilithonimonas hispanica TaxID=358687 RepID=A0A3D9CIR0_9FLAO|nr:MULTISPECIES: Ig-like domain-containing protein [Epilithonimonas]REC65648.1 hypothetical protein DRF58_17750 [Epilithonimonas hispanica]
MKQICTIIFSILFTSAFSQNSNKIFTSDIDNFWAAYDSIQNTNDYNQKLDLINKLYIQRGTKGLHAFMKARSYNDTLYVELIKDYPKFWHSIRPNTLKVKNKTAELNNAVENLKKLYPELKDAEMYFTIGGLRSGGTVTDNMVLVGAEIATGNSYVDVSEFQNNWLKNVFAKQSLDNIVYLNIHEYIHTQQNGDRNRVLSQSIKEGACDFIAELAIKKPIETQYLTYGRNHKNEIKGLFKKEMFSNNFTNWLYNGSQKEESADLGYYVGYEICKSYYDNSEDKTKAIKDIIELNYDDDKAVEEFLVKSKFFTEKINKKKIIKEYSKNQPYIVKIEPFKNGTDNVDPNTKELKITFSKEMNTKNFSISYSEKGKEYFPITKVKGYENNDKTLVLLIDLKPNKEYEFVITNRSFMSKDGFLLVSEEYPVNFKTK